MKKMFSILLAVVITICLINLNHNNAIADEANSDYTYTWDGTNWSSNPETIYNVGDTIKIEKTGEAKVKLAINGMQKSTTSPYTIISGAKLELTTDSSGNGLAKIADRDFTKPVWC